MSQEDTQQPMNLDLMILGSILRQHRKRRKRAQARVAFTADMDESYLSSVENGHYNISIRKFVALCKALEIEPDVIMAEFITRTEQLHEDYEEDWPPWFDEIL